MKQIAITVIMIAAAIIVYARAPARAMEEEEIWVRIVTGQRLRCIVKPGHTRCLPVRSIRRGHVRG